MKTKYEVIDNPFNRENYPDLIGKILDNPPAYAQVKLIKEKMPMSEIYKLQSRMFEEKESTDMVEDFVMKCLRAGYDKQEIIEGIREFYRQAPEVGNQIFTRAVVKMKNLGKNVNELLQPKKAEAKGWYKKAQFNKNPDIYTADVNVNMMGYPYDLYEATANKIPIRFFIDIEARDWGIKDINVHVVDNIVDIPFVLSYNDGRTEDRAIKVDMQKLKFMNIGRWELLP